MKKWYQSKTLWFNVITLILGLGSVLVKIVPAPVGALITTVVIPLGNIILRIWFTNVPIG